MDPISTSNPPSAVTDTAPVSPVARSTSFPHKTSSAVAPSKPSIDTSTPAINTEPIEMDASPTVERRGTGVSEEGEGRMFSPDQDDEILEELGVKGEGVGVREKRAAMLAARSKDPAVLVDIPHDPNAEEVAAANTVAGQTTPAPERADPLEREEGEGEGR
ncbi:uncharacterized protein BDZ99DRAFT_573698 [Mytilinidion resinicola]|uniref:Uncharacterized protein n=1 Tax=Mytilinidion resinicola TaxID=574789 RepID=A0A6A6YER7_9PEZI|nr:uncharacterized protein BDZ99DRAFT_573698 [Mytilinidion resinicola]KAF2807023.1 hypothetical protein BDZ99DRAFT_573698 [Mytilinidion resinicola]